MLQESNPLTHTPSTYSLLFSSFSILPLFSLFFLSLFFLSTITLFVWFIWGIYEYMFTIHRYQTFTMEMGPNLDADMYQVPKYPSERPLPKPLLCGKASSSVDAILCNIALNCATSFEPRMGQGTLDLSPRYDVKQHSKQYKGWEVSLSPGEGDNTAACTGHLDQKFNTLSKNNNQWLDMKIDNVKHGTAIICEGPFSQRYAKLVGYINTTEGGNAKIKLDSHNWHYERKLSKSLCSVISDKLSPGTHMISIQTSSTKSFTGFSHLIWA